MRRRPPGPGAVVLGGDYQGLGIVRSLGRHGIPTLIVDDEPSIARASRYAWASIRVPSLRSETDVLAALALAHEKISGGERAGGRAAEDRTNADGDDAYGWVIFATRDEIVAALSRHRAELAREFRIPTPEWDCVRVAWDKRETYRLAQKLGVPAPRTWFPLDEADLEQIPVTAPVIIKPAIKENFFYATHAKAWRADTREELLRHFRKAAGIVPAGEIIVQEMIPGDGQEQYSFCAFCRDGEPVATMTVRRRRQHPSDFGRADRKSTRLNSSHMPKSRMPSSA